MDFTLNNLGDFRSALERADRSYPLCCVLLATTLDRKFILEFLCHFTELHYMTGNEVLFVGPKLVPSRENAPERDLGWQFNLSELQLRGLLETNARDETLERTFDLFLDFLHRQTAESYSFAAAIGLPPNTFPTLVFIDPTTGIDCAAVWSLNGLTGEAFTRAFRALLENLKRARGWLIRQALEDRLARIFYLKQAEKLISTPEISHLRSEALRVRRDLADTEMLNNFYSTLRRLIPLFDALRADAHCRVPTENLAKSIEKLRVGAVAYDSINHIRAHRTRWSSRLPGEYNQIAKCLELPPAKFIRDEHLITEAEVRLEASRLCEELQSVERRLSQLEDSERQRLKEEISALSGECARLEAERNQDRPPILTTIKTLLKGRLDSCGESNREAVHLCERPLRIFISYSHDSREHANRVLNLAQRLRGEGFDTWIDQFEVFPEEGFPRWMASEIAKADYVLVICTSIYLRRFEGAEIVGKGLGANYEGFLITQDLHDASMRNRKFIPVLFEPADGKHIPALLRSSRRVCLPSELPQLIQLLRGEPTAVPIPIQGHPIAVSVSTKQKWLEWLFNLVTRQR